MKENNRALDVGDKPGNLMFASNDDRVLGILRSKAMIALFFCQLLVINQSHKFENISGFADVFTKIRRINQPNHTGSLELFFLKMNNCNFYFIYL